MREGNIMLKSERDVQLMQLNPMLCDEYIEKMANFYTSEAAQIIFPDLQKIPFEEWLYRRYFLDFDRTG
jgi:hypothetical protein